MKILHFYRCENCQELHRDSCNIGYCPTCKRDICPNCKDFKCCEKIETKNNYLKTVVGLFNPKKVDDLTPESKNVIGKKFTWMYSWIIEDGEYKNQWAMTIRDRNNPNYKHVPFAWVPECDIDIESGDEA